jgi:hypothetical protein
MTRRLIDFVIWTAALLFVGGTVGVVLAGFWSGL